MKRTLTVEIDNIRILAKIYELAIILFLSGVILGISFLVGYATYNDTMNTTLLIYTILGLCWIILVIVAIIVLSYIRTFLEIIHRAKRRYDNRKHCTQCGILRYPKLDDQGYFYTLKDMCETCKNKEIEELLNVKANSIPLANVANAMKATKASDQLYDRGKRRIYSTPSKPLDQIYDKDQLLKAVVEARNLTKCVTCNNLTTNRSSCKVCISTWVMKGGQEDE